MNLLLMYNKIEQNRCIVEQKTIKINKKPFVQIVAAKLDKNIDKIQIMLYNNSVR
jgi:hypothetical protein